MSQQLAIFILVDTAGALRAGCLDDNIYLIDNAKWNGSKGEGTGALTSAVDGAGAYGGMDSQILNWLPCGLASIPRSVPQTFFIDKTNMVRAAPSQKPHRLGAAALHRVGLLRDVAGRVLDGTQDTLFHPHPEIVNITGPAVDMGVIFPAQYGSPDLFSDGLYWSASVNTSMVGQWRYTLHLAVYPSVAVSGGEPPVPVILSHDLCLDIRCKAVTNGFLSMPMMIPA